MINTDGVLEGSGFSNIPVAAKLLSCEVENDIRWKIVQEDSFHHLEQAIVKTQQTQHSVKKIFSLCTDSTPDSLLPYNKLLFYNFYNNFCM